MKILVTGSNGLIGSEAVRHFDGLGDQVLGVDNNLRASFFGQEGDTSWCLKELLGSCSRYRHVSLDIRDRDQISALFREERFDATIHCAAQPSHDKARDIPFVDFEVNAVGTLNLLEAARQHAPDAPFVFMSTNKVYGDRPNSLTLEELDTRWDYADPEYANGIAESLSVDQSMHSLFGASKLAADMLVQEYGRYFGMPTCCLRGGCLTGPNHSGVQLHGFLSYLVKCNLEGREYTVFGYKGKQVRDNIHSVDVVRFMEAFIRSPRSAAVYNLGGGKENTVSILEAFQLVESLTGQKMRWRYSDEARVGDHICYYSDLRKIRQDYPNWQITRSVSQTIAEIVEARLRRGVHAAS